MKEVSKSIQARINKAISNPKIYAEAHLLLEESIREGKNPKTGRQYRRLESSTVEHRKYIARNNPTHPEYSSNKSNLTLTGSLLKGLFTRFNKSKGILTIDIKGQHDGYKSNKGRLIKGSRQIRKDIVDGLESQGRQILTVSDTFLNKIAKRIERALRSL